MTVIGIVAEYNPFHRGHALHIRESRNRVGGDTAVVAVMSGDFVQRGEEAIYDKFTRAEAAVRGGADLVVELPLWTALSSAEDFASGSVRLLERLHADVLSFGSETGDLEPLQELAALFGSAGFTEAVKQELKTEPEQSFAAARQKVAERVLGRPLPELRQPNNILAIEYLKACRGMTPLAIRRQGAGHDDPEDSDCPSASRIRKELRAAGEGPDPDLRNLLFLDRLRRCGRNSFPDDGLGERMFREARKQSGYEEYLRACATRRYPLARIRRTALRAILDVQDAEPAFLRVLAFSDRGRDLLRDRAELPVLIKPAHVKRLSPEAVRQFEAGAAAHDFYQLLNRRTEPGEDWRKSPVPIPIVD